MAILIRDTQIIDASSYKLLREKIDGESDTWGANPGERLKTIQEVQEVIQAASQQDNSFLWVVEDVEELIGFLHVKGLKWKRTRHTVSFDIGLLKAYWGQGIADELFVRLERWAVLNGILRMELFVYEGNPRARAFYTRWGYQEEGIRKGSIYINGLLCNEIWMSKLLIQ